MKMKDSMRAMCLWIGSSIRLP